MKHFIKGSQIFAFEDDGSQDHLITADMTPITQAEIDALRAAIPPAVPQSVTMRQAREALIRRGQIATVDNAIAGMPGIEGDIARNEWNMSQVVERTRPLTLSMFNLIGVTTEVARDEWFIYAATL